MITIKLRTQLQNYCSNASQNCLNKYISSLYRLNNSVNIESSSFLDNPKEIKEFLEFKRYTEFTKKYYYQIIFIFLNSFKKKKSELINTYRNELNILNHKQRRTMILSDENKNNLIKVSEIDNIITNYKSIIRDLNILNLESIDTYKYKILQRYLILEIFKLEPKLRCSLSSIHVNKKAENINYLQYNNNTYSIHINKYKLKKYYGTLIINISENLNKYIKCLLKHNVNKNFLLVELNRNKKLNSNGFTKIILHLFKSELNKKICVNLYKYILENNNI